MARLRSKIEKTITLILSILESAFNSGIFYGWPSLVFILKQQGYFREGCGTTPITITTTTTTPTGATFNTSQYSTQIPLHYTDFGIFDWTDLQTNLQTDLQTDLAVTSIGQVHEVTSMLPCDSQDAKFQLVFTVAAFSIQASVFPSGLLFDYICTRYVRIVFSILILAGHLFLGFSTPARAEFLFPAGILIGIGGVLMMVCSMQVSNLFGPNKATIMTLMSGCFDSSAVVMLIVKLSYEAGLPMSTAFFILAGATIFFSINTFILLPRDRIPWPLPPGYTQVTLCESKEGREGTEDAEKSEKANQQAEIAISQITDLQRLKKDLDMMAQGENRTRTKTREPNQSIPAIGNSQLNNDDGHDVCEGSNRKKSRALQVEAEGSKKADFPTVRSCLKSLLFWLLVAWLSILQLRLIFFIGTFNPLLNRLSNNDEGVVSWYTNIFSFLQFCGFLVAPLGGLLLDRNKITKGWCANKRSGKRGPYADLRDTAFPLGLTTILFIVFSICIVIPKLELQYVTFTIQVVIRSFLYGLSVAAIPIMFPEEFFGTLFGVMGTVAGIFGLLQYPIFSILQKVLDNDPFILNICFIALCLFTLSLPIYIMIYVKRKERWECGLGHERSSFAYVSPLTTKEICS